MDKKWLEEQTEAVGSALAAQGIRLAVPVSKTYKKHVFREETDGKRLATFIDHTLLRPDAAKREIKKLCEEARRYGFVSVCINPVHVSLAHSLLADSDVKVCTVIGFPLGATTTLTKVWETRDAIAAGAQEIDMVINIGSLAERDYAHVYADLKAVREAASGQILKVILETSLLIKEQIVRGCILAKMAGADFVKTSTGFGPGGAAVEDVTLMREVVGSEFGVKAAGGIRDYKTAVAMLRAGANRIGASAGIDIVRG